MTAPRRSLEARARAEHARLARLRGDARYRAVVGRLVATGVLKTNLPVVRSHRPLHVADALWAGTVEPRVLEVLPALLIKRPGLFVDPTALPGDLRAAVRSLRRNETPEPFRGIPGATLRRWLPSVGRQGKLPSQTKTFRMTFEEVALLRRLGTELGECQTDVLRRALRMLGGNHDAHQVGAAVPTSKQGRRRRNGTVSSSHMTSGRRRLGPRPA